MDVHTPVPAAAVVPINTGATLLHALANDDDTAAVVLPLSDHTAALLLLLLLVPLHRCCTMASFHATRRGSSSDSSCASSSGCCRGGGMWRPQMFSSSHAAAGDRARLVAPPALRVGSAKRPGAIIFMFMFMCMVGLRVAALVLVGLAPGLRGFDGDSVAQRLVAPLTGAVEGRWRSAPSEAQCTNTSGLSGPVRVVAVVWPSEDPFDDAESRAVAVALSATEPNSMSMRAFMSVVRVLPRAGAAGQCKASTRRRSSSWDVASTSRGDNTRQRFCSCVGVCTPLKTSDLAMTDHFAPSRATACMSAQSSSAVKALRAVDCAVSLRWWVRTWSVVRSPKAKAMSLYDLPSACRRTSRALSSGFH
eukprot:PhM_4_TR3525/c0_g1_i1/m.105193